MRVRVDIRRMIASGWRTAPKVQGGKIMSFMRLIDDGAGAVFVTCDDIGRGHISDRKQFPNMVCVEVVDAADGERAWTMIYPEDLFGVGLTASAVAQDLWHQAWDEIPDGGACKNGFTHLIPGLHWSRYKPSWRALVDSRSGEVIDPSGFDI